MGFGTSDGQYFDDETAYLSDKASAISIRTAPQGSTEATGALKSTGSTQTPENSSRAENDYDYAGWQAANPGVTMSPGQHYPDTFKLPNHITFSNESQYSTPEKQGGQWTQAQDGSYTFVPSAFNLTQHSPEELKNYFSQYEKGNRLNIIPDFTNDRPHDIVEKVVGGLATGIGNALTLPGDIYSGKVKAGSDEEIERAADLAGLMVAGPAPIAAKAADGTLGSFAGVTSKTIDKGALDVANAAEKAGHSADEIYNSTGFFKGPDNRWRYELDDSALKWNPPKPSYSLFNSKLSDHLDHPELYKAYPDLKNMKVVVDPYHHPEGAAYNGDKIILGTNAAKEPEALMHEVQHAIQDREGFAQGGQVGKQNKDYKLRYEDDIDKLRKPFFNLQAKEDSGGMLSAPEQAKLDYLKHIFQHYSKYARAGEEQARQNYLALAGETESRNVETRLDLTPVERTRFNPADTMDVSPENQLVSMVPVATTPYGMKEPSRFAPKR